MESGSITPYIDVAQLVLYAFWIFFAGLIYYLHRENKREGYPLESDRSAHIKVQGWPAVPAPKTYRLADGETVQVPNDKPCNQPPLHEGAWRGRAAGAHRQPAAGRRGPGQPGTTAPTCPTAPWRARPAWCRCGRMRSLTCPARTPTRAACQWWAPTASVAAWWWTCGWTAPRCCSATSSWKWPAAGACCCR